MILSFSLKLFDENTLVKNVKVFPLNMKLINPIQKSYESYACILKIFVIIVDPLINFLNSFGMR